MMLSSILKRNLFAIIYINFKMFGFRTALKLPIDIYYGIRFKSSKGQIVLNTNHIRRGMIKIGFQGSDMFQHEDSIFLIDGVLKINGSCVFGVANSLIIKNGAEVTIGDKAIFGAYNMIYCEKSVSFGSGFLSSWKCQILDSDTHKIVDIETGKTEETKKEIRIGSNCWLGNNVMINKGVWLPDNTIVASRSLITKDLRKEGLFCVLAGIPAKVVRRNKKWFI